MKPTIESASARHVRKRLRAIVESLVKLDPSDTNFLIAFVGLQARGQLALQETKLGPGNPAFALAQARAIESRQRAVEEHRAGVRPMIKKAQEEGATTLREIAAYLNETDVRPRRAEKWTPALVSRVIRES